MSHWPWWMWVMVIGAASFIICKVPIIVDKLREVGKVKPATPSPAKKDNELANPPVACTAVQPEQPKEEFDPSQFALPDRLVVVTLKPMRMMEAVRLVGVHIDDVRNLTGEELSRYWRSRH